MTQFLLSNGADIDVRTTGENQAPIHYAAKNGATKSLRVLLGFHADINSMDCKQRTPLQVSSCSCSKITVFKIVGWCQTTSSGSIHSIQVSCCRKFCVFLVTKNLLQQN